MMNKKRTKEIGRTKYLMFLPLAALLMIISNIEAVARTTKQIATEVMEAVDSKSGQPIQNAQATPRPEQEKGKVTYKGKVVDKNGKPLKGVQLLIKPDATPSQLTTGADGSFAFKISEKPKVMFLYQDGDKEKAMGFTDERVPQDNRENWIVVYDEKWFDVRKSDPGTPDNPIFEVVEHMPEFPNGGMGALMKYLNENMQYPASAKEKGIQGRITLQFVVDKDGSISGTKVLRGVDADLDKEAIRLINNMPNWKPGTQGGQPVRVKYTVPVMFRLTPDDKKPEQEYKPVNGQPSEVVAVASATTPPAEPEGVVFEVVENMPEFPGGMEGLMQYISRNIKYPVEAHKAGIQGRVMIQLIVDKEGNAGHAKIVQGTDSLLNAEALRIVSNMPKWKPGTQRGQAVNVKYTFPIMFKIQ